MTRELTVISPGTITEFDREPQNVRQVIDLIIKAYANVDLVGLAKIEVFCQRANGRNGWTLARKACKNGDIPAAAAFLKIAEKLEGDHGISGDYKAAILMGAFENRANKQETCGLAGIKEAEQLRRMAHLIGRMDY